MKWVMWFAILVKCPINPFLWPPGFNLENNDWNNHVLLLWVVIIFNQILKFFFLQIWTKHNVSQCRTIDAPIPFNHPSCLKTISYRMKISTVLHLCAANYFKNDKKENDSENGLIHLRIICPIDSINMKALPKLVPYYNNISFLIISLLSKFSFLTHISTPPIPPLSNFNIV